MAHPRFFDRGGVLWVDPGLISGWAYYHAQQDFFESGQDLFLPFGIFLATMVELSHHTLSVGWERFLVAGRRVGEAAYSMEVIGMIKWIARDCTLLEPTASASRSMASPAVLKRLGWWNPGHQHANDAAQHLLTWYTADKSRLTPAMERAFRDDLHEV
jgi:hypothetical protein